MSKPDKKHRQNARRARVPRKGRRPSATSARKLVGYITVSGGSVVIADPLYLGDLQDADEDMHSALFSDLEAGQVDLKENRSAVVSGSGLGDGRYPVYAIYEGRIVAALHVEFVHTPRR